MLMSRENVKLGVVAVTCIVVSTMGPSFAAGVLAANSDKVDGFHAVKSATKIKKRKGKLVATSPRTGRLPNNIIKKAKNADKLDGLDSTAFLTTAASADFWKKTDAIDAATLEGKHAVDFWQKTDPLDADTLDGKHAADFLSTTDTIDADTIGGLTPDNFLQVPAGTTVDLNQIRSHWVSVDASGVQSSLPNATITRPSAGGSCVNFDGRLNLAAAGSPQPGAANEARTLEVSTTSYTGCSGEWDIAVVTRSNGTPTNMPYNLVVSIRS